METLIQSLISAGLSDKESRVYISLLQLGKSSAYGISVKSGLKKPTTYVILDELLKKGLVLKIPRAKKQQYIAKSPEEFFSLAEEKLRMAKKSLPQLQSLVQGESNTKVLLFEGLSGMEQICFYKMDELKDSEDIGFWAKSEGVSDSFFEIASRWAKSLLKNNITMSGITPDNRSVHEWMPQHPAMKHTHLIPETDYSSKISIDVTKKFVRVVDGHALQGIIIENERVADTLRQIFKLVMKQYEGKKDEEKSPLPL
jgi:sugar-specific transcriptional regulator TrmB